MVVQNVFGAPYIPSPKVRGFTANRINVLCTTPANFFTAVLYEFLFSL
jgi:hypothetical protein